MGIVVVFEYSWSSPRIVGSLTTQPLVLRSVRGIHVLD